MKLQGVLLSWVLVIAWMALIFYVSSDNTWTAITGPPFVRALRKSGHIFEYSVLALLVGRALMTVWSARGEIATRTVLLRTWRLGVVICTLYAISDEVHQSFVPGRFGHPADVLIDALSATAALGIWYIIRIHKKRNANPRLLEQE